MMNYELGIMNGGTCHPWLKREKPSFIPHSSFLIPRSSPAFTIVELLMVIGIISVLITITVSAVSGSIQRARAQKANAICKIVEQGIATYYAQKDEWPASALNKDSITPNADANGDMSAQNKTAYLLSADEVREAVKNVIQESAGGNPMMDLSGLYVSQSSGEAGTKGYGMDFMDAVRGTKRNPKGIRLDNMNFGYPEADKGYFRRFKMIYLPESDKLSVMQQ